MSGPQIAERRTVDLEAGTICYRVAGADDGRPVVFVHGFLVDEALWADVPERLGGRGFDPTDHGRTAPCPPWAKE